MQKEELLRLIKLYNQDIKKLDEINNEEIKLLFTSLQNHNLIGMTNSGYFKKLKKNKVFLGKLQKKTSFGFVIVEGEPDFFVSNVDKYFDGDEVLIIKQNSLGKSDGGKIIGLYERANAYIVLKKEKPYEYRDLSQKLTGKFNLEGIDDEQIKKGTILSAYIKNKKNDQITVILHNIITDENDPDKEMKIILDKYDIEVDFSKEVLDELSQIKEEITEEEKIDRIDLREKLFFTIDGKDSKDLDDAISLNKEGENYRLYVAIADVSHYLKENSALDLSARDRATSAYFIDRVVPMIPKKISNGICSLHANVDRLTMTCEMEINPQGEVLKTKIYNSIINSKHRLVYEDINQIFHENNKQLIQKYADIYGVLMEMNKLAKILNKKRLNKGSFNLEDTEAKFILDEEQNIKDIIPVERQDSERLIEEFMVLANESVTKFVTTQKLPFLYRIHGTPNPKKLTDLKNLLHYLNLDINLDFENLNPLDLKDIFDQLADDTLKRIVSKNIVRSMQKAIYSSENIGHFGLALADYTHFTSPIRRYPDLEVHRLLKAYIQHEKLHTTEKIATIAEHASLKEVNAARASMEIEDMKKAQYMQQYIGENFEGTISSIEDYGIFVELENTIRGLIRFNDLKNFQSHNPFEVIFKNENKLKYGEKITVTVVGVNLAFGLVDFIPVGYNIYTEEEKQLQKLQQKKEKNKKIFRNKKAKINYDQKRNKKEKYVKTKRKKNQNQKIKAKKKSDKK